MKVIDILNKIANDEEVPKFIVCDDTYYISDNGFLIEQGVGETQWYIDKKWLNEEVEIIEEDKKIEKLIFNKDQDGDILVNGVSLIEKVNEIIDVVNKLKEER